MQYLGHKKLDTTQKYLKNVQLEDDQIIKMFGIPQNSFAEEEK